MDKDTHYVFVYLKTANQIEKNMPPEYFVVPGRDLIEKNLITDWGAKQGVKYLDLDNAMYRDRWDKFTKDR